MRFPSFALPRQNLTDLALLAGAAALLPFIPDKTTGPLHAFNPYKIWLIVTLLLGIGTLGQLLCRFVGTRAGLPLAGFVSGFVSSTATILALGLQAKQHPASHEPCVAGATASCVATYAQMALLLMALSTPLLQALLPALALGCVASALYSISFIHRAAANTDIELPAGKPIITLRTALAMAGLIALISFAVVALNHFVGEKGVWLGAALAGLSDAHAAGATVATLVQQGQMDVAAGIIPVMLGLTTNTLLRAVLATTTGSKIYAQELIPGLALGLGAAWAGTLFILL